ncbi:MAG: hypothetical protein KKB13_24175 [Chloroflexi bacterium]|nr:hypothetical protein [Chloroflexota bacterium]
MDLAHLTIPALDQISASLLMLGLFITAGSLILSRGWRMSLLILLVQYAIVGLWLVKLYRPEVLLLKVLTGTVVVAMIYLVAAEVQWGFLRRPRPEPAPDDASQIAEDVPVEVVTRTGAVMGVGFRLAAVVLAAAATLALARGYPLAELPTDVNLAFYWLCAAGLICFTTSRDVVYTGLGVLCLLSGLDLFYVAVVDVPDIVVLGLLAGMNLAAALTIARAIDTASTLVEARPARQQTGT